MRLGPRARARLRKRNAINAAAKVRALVSDPKGSLLPDGTVGLVLSPHVRLHVKALGVSEPVGRPSIGNRFYDANANRAQLRANGGKSKDVREHYPEADPMRNAVPSYVPPGDPDRIIQRTTKARAHKPALVVSKVFPQNHPNPSVRGKWSRKTYCE